MKVLAADEYILCCGLVRTLQLLREDVCVTSANSIDEMLTLIPGLPDLGLVLLDTTRNGKLRGIETVGREASRRTHCCHVAQRK